MASSGAFSGGDLNLARQIRDELRSKKKSWHSQEKSCSGRKPHASGDFQPGGGSHGNLRGAQVTSGATQYSGSQRPPATAHQWPGLSEDDALEVKRIWASGTQTPGPRLVDTPLLVDSFAAGHQPIASQAPPTKETPLQTVSYGSGSSDGIGNYLSRTPTSAVSGYPSIGGLSQNVAYSGLPPAWTSIPPTVPVTGSASATMASAAMATPTRTSSGAPFMTPQDVQSGMPAAVQQVANTGLIDINFDGADQAGAYRGGRSPTNGDLLTAFSENIDYPTLQPAPPPCICEQYQPNGLAKSLWNQGDTISDVQAPFTYVGPLLRRVRCAVHGELPIIELRDARGPVGETIITPIIRPQAQTSRPLNALAPAFIPRKTAAYKPTQPEFTPGSASFEHVTTPSDLATTSTSPKTTTSEGPPGFQTSAAGCGLAASRWA